jgi:SAM-dependent methyltransferase
MNTDAYRYSEVQYLRAKRSVDDRALNGHVLEALAGALRALSQPPRVLELGAGVGTTVSRMAERGYIRHGRYTLVDRDGASLSAAAEHLRRWGGSGTTVGDEGPRSLSVRRTGGIELAVELVEADAFSWLESADAAHYDLVVANAFLDLVDVRALLPLVWRRVGPGRPFWFSINFDGETIFLPELDADADLLRLYHHTMDERVRYGRRAGESKTGRRLLQVLPESGARILAAGSSDWVVWPTEGAYPEDEAIFLHHIVATIHGALDGSAGLSEGELTAWVETRHQQIERGELVYIAHQLDVAGLAPARP